MEQPETSPPHDEQDEEILYDEPIEEREEPQSENKEDKEELTAEDDTDSPEISSHNRGPKFRKELLQQVPKFNFPDSLSKDSLELNSILSPLININADTFITELRKIIKEEE